MGADLSRLARDTVYVAVGFGLLGLQQLQVRRREIERRLGPVVGDTVGQVAHLFGHRRP